MFEDDPARDGDGPACRLAVKVVPGSRKNALAGMLGDRLKLRVAAPPEDGKANRAVCALLAEHLGVRERDVTVVAGHSSPEKTIRVAGLNAATVRGRLAIE